MIKYAVGTSVVFVASLIWLFLAWSHGNRSNDWPSVTAKIEGNSVERTAYGKKRGFQTTVSYEVDRVEFVGNVYEYLIGEETTVYYNPENPQEVVGKKGATIRHTGLPIVISAASGLFAIVLLLIAFSPKDDSY